MKESRNAGIDRNFTRCWGLVRFGYSIEEISERMGLRVEEVQSYIDKIPLYNEMLLEYDRGLNRKQNTERFKELIAEFRV